MTAMAVVEFLLNSSAAMRYVRTTWGRLLGALTPSFLLAAVMFGVLYIGNPHLLGMHIVLRLAIDILAGAAIYIALAWLLRLRALREGFDLVKGMINR